MSHQTVLVRPTETAISDGGDTTARALDLVAYARQHRYPSIFDTIDEFVAAVPWTKNRMVLVFLRHHGGRSYVRLRTFNRHKTKGCWYPSPHYFVVPEECAFDLAEAIEAAGMGGPMESPPDWYHDFLKQYQTYRATSQKPVVDEPKDGGSLGHAHSPTFTTDSDCV